MNGFSLRALRFIVAVLAFAAVPAQADLPEIALSVNGYKLTAEPARSQGLMHRRILPENRGMLFVFADVSRHAMWMMNTHIPLSVAFLDERGVIVNIADMKPHTQDTHPAAQPAKYALEMNRGWFEKRGIPPGARIEGIE